jgi:hypothetical protein
VAGGALAVRPDLHGQLEVLESCYEVRLGLAAPVAVDLRYGQTGKLWLTTRQPRSRIADLLRSVSGAALRESGF